MRVRWQEGCLWAAAMVVLSAGVHAQSVGTVTPEEEYKKLITIDETVQPLGAHPFGENISLYDGTLSFEMADINVPGNGPAIRLGRSLTPARGPGYALNELRPFGDWDLDIPRIETLVGSPTLMASGALWRNSSGATRRCSSFTVPPVYGPTQGGADPWTPDQWWYGVHLILPGQGRQALLPRSSQNPLTPSMGGMSFPIVTKQNWMIGCGVTASDGGEGFLALAPDGTRYTFARLVYRPTANITSPLGTPPDLGFAIGIQPMAAPFNILARRNALMYVTQIQDRFGNTLTYDYSGDNLSSIVASDGRRVDIAYVAGTPRIAAITIAATGGTSRTWAYSYDTSNSELPTLTGVQLPDGSHWTYQLGLFQTATIETVGGNCTAKTLPQLASASVTGSITHPSGLTGTFTLTPTLRGRSYVPWQCYGTTSETQSGNLPNARYPQYSTQFSLTSEVLTGAGLPSETWGYRYSPANQSWANDACAISGTCVATVHTDVTDPSGHAVRYTFSNRFDATEGQLLRTDSYSGAVGSTLLRSETNTYANPTGGPWPAAYGFNLLGRNNTAQTVQASPLLKRETTQDGDTYTWQAESFDAYAQVTGTKRFSNVTPGPSMIEETTSYLNDTSLWVLGLPLTVTNITNAGAPEVESSNAYDGLGRLVSRARFGQALMSYTWTAGQLASFTDGNGNTTSLGDYKRGIPQAIGYPDGKSQSLVVDDFGQISSITDQTGATTSYAYDAVGRLSSITYPSGDEQAWLSSTFAYDYVPGAERGLAGGHWRRTASVGNARTVSYFDAMLRPVLSDRYISGAAGSNATTLTNYDAKGQTVFASYPNAIALDFTTVRDPASRPGVSNGYDALGRLTQATRDSELGALTTATAYLSGARVQVTDPKGNVTVTSHQVFDQPGYGVVTQVQAPGGLNQIIARNLYGEPQSIRQYGSNQGLAGDVTRWYVYDSHHRLCRTLDPETGSTVTAYDGANNVAWTAEGQSIAGTTDCGQTQVAAGARTARTYDAMNRVRTIQPPANTPSITYDYDAAGRVVSAISDGSALKSTWSGSYNKRGALTGESLQLTGHAAWGIGYTHDAYGSVSSVHYPDGQHVDYTPDALGRPTRVGSYATGIGYFPNGEVHQFFYENGAAYVAEQNRRQLLSNFSYGQGSPLILSEDYTYDANGNLTAVNDLAGGLRSKTMGYDALDRLTSATAPNLYGTESYTYDPINNLRSRVTGGQTLTYQYDGSNLLASITSGGSTIASYGYDTRGNQTLRNGASHLFDARNQLTQIQGVGSYAYDAAGRRVVKTPANGGASAYYFYNQAGQLMYQVEPGKARTTSFVYLGRKLVGSNEELLLTAPATVSADPSPSDGSHTVSWSAVPGATSYVLQESVNGGGWSTIYSGGATSQALDGKAGGGYTYRVEACVGATCGGWTTSATLGVRPALPTVSVPTGTINGTYTVSWTAPTGATAYDVQERFDGGSWTTIASNTTTNAISRPGTTSGSYTYQVSAGNAYGSRGWAGSAAVTVDTTYGVVPAAPTGFSVPAASADGSAAIGWNAAALASRYVLQQSANGGNWATVHDGGVIGTALSGLANGSYTYQLQACNEYGCSAWINGGPLVVTRPPTTAPSVSVPGNSNSGGYTVSWNAIATATSYTLQESANGGGWATVQSNGTTSRGISGKGNGSYGYRVQACNVGGCGPRSGTGTVTVLLPPAGAPGLSVPASSSNGSYTVSWSGVATATSYTLQESNNGGGWVTVQANGNASWATSSRGNGSYGYRVQACNGGGCGPWSGTGTINVLLPPSGAPSLSVPGSSTTGSYTVSWGWVATAASYTLQESVNGGGWVTLQANGNTSWNAGGKGNGSYGYQVQACNAAGCGPWSGTSSVTVALVPPVPVGAYVEEFWTPKTSGYRAHWSAVAGASRYEAIRNDTGASVYNGTNTTFLIGSAFMPELPTYYSFSVRACNAVGCSAWAVGY